MSDFGGLLTAQNSILLASTDEIYNSYNVIKSSVYKFRLSCYFLHVFLKITYFFLKIA